MSSMPKVIITGLFLVSMTIVFYSLLAEGFFTLIDTFDDLVEEQGQSSLTNFWNMAGSTLRFGYFLLAIATIIGIIMWIYLNSQRREYVTAGGIYG